jgi:hypothetical protein
MKLSTLWIGLAVTLALDGHPLTAVFSLVIWVLHHRIELSRA